MVQATEPVTTGRQDHVDGFLAAGQADEQANDHVDDTGGQEASLNDRQGVRVSQTRRTADWVIAMTARKYS